MLLQWTCRCAVSGRPFSGRNSRPSVAQLKGSDLATLLAAPPATASHRADEALAQSTRDAHRRNPTGPSRRPSCHCALRDTVATTRAVLRGVVGESPWRVFARRCSNLQNCFCQTKVVAPSFFLVLLHPLSFFCAVRFSAFLFKRGSREEIAFHCGNAGVQ
jgi:hypothetical protein